MKQREAQRHTHTERSSVIKRAEGTGTDRFIKIGAEGRGGGGGGVVGSREHKGAHSNLE